MVKKMKRSFLILIISVFALFFGACSNQNAETNQEQQVVQDETNIATESLTVFEQFENALKDNNLEYEKVTMAAEFVGAEEGYKYKFSDGEKVEIYRLDENSDAFSYVKENNSIYLDGFGAIPVEVNKNFVMINTDTEENQEKFSNLFSNLSI